MSTVKLNGATDGDLSRLSRRTETERVSSNSDTSVAANVTPKPATDHVKVSDRASTVRGLVEKSATLPDVRQERVDALKSQIQAGNYRPPATSIADALIRSEG